MEPVPASESDFLWRSVLLPRYFTRTASAALFFFVSAHSNHCLPARMHKRYNHKKSHLVHGIERTDSLRDRVKRLVERVLDSSLQGLHACSSLTGD